MGGMLLFPEVDEGKTAKNVRHFLKRTYKDACHVAGSPVNYLKSPAISGMPKSPGVENKAEDQLIRRLDAQEVVDWTRKALAVMHECDQWNWYLLTECYIKNRDNQTIADDLGYGRTRMQEMLRDACCALAGYLRSCSHGHIDLIAFLP